MGIESRLSEIDWNSIKASLNEVGFATVPHILSPQQCQTLIENYDDTQAYRKTVVMERYRFGMGEYKYFNYPLPEITQKLRNGIYPHLAPIANEWMRLLKIDTTYPSTLADLHTLCHASGQFKPTPLILKYGPGGYNTLHQDLYGTVYFPIQAVFFLDEPRLDYTGGEFVMTQQTPRAQSKAIVLSPKKGDMLLFTTSFRPVKGTKGYYRVNMKHGVSEVREGQRHTLGIIFHDATS